MKQEVSINSIPRLCEEMYRLAEKCAKEQVEAGERDTGPRRRADGNYALEDVELSANETLRRRRQTYLTHFLAVLETAVSPVSLSCEHLDIV